MKTMGIVVVAALATCTLSPAVAITATFRRTNSAASPGSRSLIVGAAEFDRNVLAFDISGFFEALTKCAQAALQHLGGLLSRKPTTGMAGCCARAASGQAITVLPRSVMNSRRFIGSPRGRP